MKSIVLALALASFIGASTVPYVAATAATTQTGAKTKKHPLHKQVSHKQTKPKQTTKRPVSPAT
jgi:Ni/Co efflux regulator RcnB